MKILLYVLIFVAIGFFILFALTNSQSGLVEIVDQILGSLYK